MKTTVSLDLPPRYRESAFRFYERIIVHILKNHPQPVTFTPANYQRSPETFSTRLRDAMNSYRMYAWQSVIDRDLFDTIHPSLIVSRPINAPDKVLVGTREALKVAVVPLEPKDSYVPEGFPYGTVRTWEELEVLCRLASERLLSKPLTLNIVPADWLSRAYKSFDVDLEKQPDGTWMLT